LLNLFSSILFLIGIGFHPSLIHGQTSPNLATEASRMDSLAASQGQITVIDKISGEFSSFLGPDSRAVVVGLRNGTPIDLSTAAANPITGGKPMVTKTTITPPSEKMGFGNVFISLALAKQQLNQVGIAQPTPSQLQAALLGGSITIGTGAAATTTNFQGILAMRESMGWGRIARELNLNLGKVVSGLKASNNALATAPISSTGNGAVNTGGKPVSSSDSGVVTGSGKSFGKVEKGVIIGGSELGDGIVAGSGRPVVTEGSLVTGRGQAYGGSGGNHVGGGQARGHGK
jgi:hypothetical protein